MPARDRWFETARFRLRGSTARAVDDLRADVAGLITAVERLEARLARFEDEQRGEARQSRNARESLSDDRPPRDDRPISGRSLESLRRSVKAESSRVRAMRGTLAAMERRRKIDLKWRRIFINQLTALIRHLCLPLDRLSPPYAFTARRFRLRSQNEEDGVLLALLSQAGWGRSRFVEIGSGASGGNAAALAHECGWAGLMLELSEASVEAARKAFAANRGVIVVAARVTPDNVNALLASHGYADDVDVLSIDIDSYDYWVLDALTVVSPRVLVLEYNALFGPERRVTIPLDQALGDAPKGSHGASLAALAALASRKGYRLVACENAGVNAFFLRSDVAPAVPGITASEAFRPLLSRAEAEDAERPSDLYDRIAARGLPLVEV